MRVLDIGCGRGEVSLLLAKMVGSVGEVIGIDQDESAIDLARVFHMQPRRAHPPFAEITTRQEPE